MLEFPRRYLIVVALLLAGTAAAWAIRRAPAGGAQFGSTWPGSSQYTLTADIDVWRRTRRERQVLTPYALRPGDDLGDLPRQIGDWQGVDVDDIDPEVENTLEPEAYLPRIYRRQDGRFVWFSLIASRRAASFHPPQICYGGWHTVVCSEAIPLKKGELYALTLLATRE
jgi:hypothetical protein